VLGRALLLVIALAAAGWLASAYGGARDEARAQVTTAKPAPAQLRASIRRLEAARRRRPDSTVVPRLAGFLVIDGQAARAAALLRPLLRAEPDNATGWAVLTLALAHSDPAGARAALRRRLALVPPRRP
jgi:predicted Zn-dependent protease